MSEHSEEEKALGLEECPCDGYDSYGQPCEECGESVKLMDHTHYKGQLFHLYCLLLVALRGCK